MARKTFSNLTALLLLAPFYSQTAWAAPEEPAAASSTTSARRGAGRAPGSRLQFIEESKGGGSPKFVVKDENGVRWRVKAGPEAKPETAASLLVRAAGYMADEDYYRAQIRVEGLPSLSRGKKYVSAGGIVREVRLERENEQKAGENWNWHKTRPADLQAFNGLRVMMALINNWDLKTVNNSTSDQGDGKQLLVVSDLGATFGKTGNTFTRSKGDLDDYVNSEFVSKVTSEHVDFVMNSRPFFLVSVIRPKYYVERTRMERVTRHIPIDDARALGVRLSRLSIRKIQECFRDAGYSPSEVDGYTKAVRTRIATLKNL